MNTALFSVSPRIRPILRVTHMSLGITVTSELSTRRRYTIRGSRLRNISRVTVNKMKKVIVIGCSGSGKSVFSRSFSAISGLTLYHLDNIWWREDGTNITRDEFDARLGEILDRDEWIIDGNYQRTMERRMKACDTVIFFDLPVEVCLDGIRARKGKSRPDMPWKDAPEDDDEAFMEFIRGYNENNRPRVVALLEKYSDKDIIVFKSREESDEFLKRF